MKWIPLRVKCQGLCEPMDKKIPCPAPLSMEFSRQEYWSGLPFPSLGDLPYPGIEPWSPALQADSLPTEPLGKVKIFSALLSDHATSPHLTFLLFSRSVMSDSLWPYGLQHTSLSCPSLSPRVCSNSCPLSQWCHSTISSSITPFSSCPQSGSFHST